MSGFGQSKIEYIVKMVSIFFVNDIEASLLSALHSLCHLATASKFPGHHHLQIRIIKGSIVLEQEKGLVQF